jgi:uncharacterized protein (DUF1800 family)
MAPGFPGVPGAGLETSGGGGVAAVATADDIALLFGRAAFGATKNDLTIYAGQDYAQVVDLMFPPPQPVQPLTLPSAAQGQGVPPAQAGLSYAPPTIPPQPDDARRVQLETATTDLLAGQRWWLNRMSTGLFPLAEKMTLFWHTHFATAFAQPPDVGHLIVQNETIRRNCLGDLRQMLYQLTVDPAMLYWLSGYVNRRGAVNENYARELFELFTMGTRPQTYTETDIRQAAKSLTGWIVNADRKSVFNEANHDRTAKTVFGTTIPAYPAKDQRNAEEYKLIVDLALKQPTTARFIAYKIVSAFAYVPQTTNLVTNPDPLVDAVANALRPADPAGVWDIAKAMKVLLNHPTFRTPNHTTGTVLVRSPIEVTTHLAKVLMIEVDPPGAINDTGNGNHNQPIFALRRMGQVPFQPPNVGGWPKGTAWLSTIQTRGRYDLVRYLLNRYTFENRQNTNPMPASTDIAGWTAFLGLGHLSALTHNRLNAYLASPGTSDERTKQESILFLLVSSPDWQVM